MMNSNVIRSRNHSIKPNFSHQPELLPSLILHCLIFLVGVVGHLSLLYYLHTRHIRFLFNAQSQLVQEIQWRVMISWV